MIHICTTVFNRYDLLARQFASIAANPVRVEHVYVINRGPEYVDAGALQGLPLTVLTTPSQCLAEAWNWFLRNVPDDRLIVGEDVHFGPQAFYNVVSSPAGCLGLEDGHSAQFSAFVLRDAVVTQIGYFDETISPDYVYYEDIDYKRRMALAGLTIAPWYDVRHDHAADNHGTLGAKTPEQIADHHRRFVIAQEHYVRKWGGLPPRETVRHPFTETTHERRSHP